MIYGRLEQGSDPINVFQILFILKPLNLASYVIVASSHFISMFIYSKCDKNHIAYIISQLLLRLAIIFIPILLGSLTVTEAIFATTNGNSVEYSLFFTLLGVISLLAFSIGNLEFNYDRQLKYIIIVPMASLIMLIYQSDYMSVTIGLTVGLIFTFYIHYQSDVIINNNISQVYVDDVLVTAAQCLNPIQLLNNFIQHIIYWRINRVYISQVQ